jgi:DNA-binding MarR family transcriptional regulator
VILPSLKAAAVDRRLGDTSLRVLVLLHGHLDLVRHRPMKAWVIAGSLGVKPHTAAAALRQLVRCGYLEEGPRQARRVGSYRLVPTFDLEPEQSIALSSRATAP